MTGGDSLIPLTHQTKGLCIFPTGEIKESAGLSTADCSLTCRRFARGWLAATHTGSDRGERSPCSYS
jgi:hypothetical protein